MCGTHLNVISHLSLCSVSRTTLRHFCLLRSFPLNISTIQKFHNIQILFTQFNNISILYRCTMPKATLNWDSTDTWKRLMASVVATGVKVSKTHAFLPSTR